MRRIFNYHIVIFLLLITLLSISKAQTASVELPKVTPKNNVFYNVVPRDIIVKVDAFGRSIDSVTANGASLAFSKKAYPYQEGAWLMRIDSSGLLALPRGEQELRITLDGGESILMHIKVMDSRSPALLTIVAPDVNHGNSVLIIFPTGKTLLIDCAKVMWRDRVVIPLLKKNGIDKLDYFIITHYDEDHDSGDGGAKIKSEFDVGQFYDYNSFTVGQMLDLEKTKIKILNAYESGTDENTRSLSFQLKYKGFIYVHGADTYAINQAAIMRRFPNDLKAHVFFGNHHFHGSLDYKYVRAMDPVLVLVQAEKAIYERDAYMVVFKQQIAGWLRKNNKRFIEAVPSLEVGTVVIRVNDANDWTYETYKDTLTPVIPFLRKKNKVVLEK